MAKKKASRPQRDAAEASETEVLGQVTVPSGLLLVVDTGLLKFWRHDGPPVMLEGQLPDDVVAAANAAVDFRIVGPDAERAGKAFGRQWNPRFVFDIPPMGVDDTQKSFAACVRKDRLNAKLEKTKQRISHRQRVDEALAYGGAAGVVQFHGLCAIAAQAPADRALTVLGQRMPKGPDESRWRSVWLECLPRGKSSRSELVGHVAVDEARLMFADVDALGHWQHEEPIDGKADFVFWGRDAHKAAKTQKAEDLGDDAFGWVDLPVLEIVKRGTAVEELRDQRDYQFATDFRPHSHHYQVMEQVRATPTESGTIEVGGARVCTFMTTWGDGYYPVYRDVDAQGRLVRVRIDLGNDEIVERQRQLEE